MTGAAEQFDSAGQAIAGVIEDTFDHPGVPDAFQRLWVPHRMVYIGGQDKPEDPSAPKCPFCRAAASDDDAASLVVRRGSQCFTLMNLYPYNPGHLLVLPYRHVADCRTH